MPQALSHVVKQWIARALALCVIGPVCANIASGVIASDGSHNTTFLTAYSSGITGLLIVLGIALSFTFVIAAVADRKEAILNAALVLGWVAWSGGRLGDMYRLAPESGTLGMVAFEALIISAITLFVLGVMPRSKDEKLDVTRFDAPFLKQALFTQAGGVSFAAALVAGLLVATVLGQSDLPGQSVGVGFFAGIAGGLAGTLCAVSTQKSNKQYTSTPFAPMCIAIMLCGVVAPLIGLIKPGPSELLSLGLAGDLPGFLIVSPIAWVMGALLGVPVGHSWVESTATQAANTATKPV